MTFFPTLPSVNENSEQDVKYLMQNQCLNFLTMDLVLEIYRFITFLGILSCALLPGWV